MSPTTVTPTTGTPTTSAPTTMNPTIPELSSTTDIFPEWPDFSSTMGIFPEFSSTDESLLTTTLQITPAPVTPSPVTPAPVTPAPVTSTSTVTTDNPTTARPTTDNPTDAPTDHSTTTPTTSNPTTVEPTIVIFTTEDLDAAPDPVTTDAIVLPESCNDRCDAFSVTVQDYFYVSDGNTDNICITYKVERLFADSSCKKSVKYIVLGLCGDDEGVASYNDLNGILQDCKLMNDKGIQRRLGRSSSSSSSSDEGYRDCWGSQSDDITGIRVNIRVNTEAIFELCMVDVFQEPLEFSDTIKFQRGKRKFTCSTDDDESYLEGLPCLDPTKFEAGGYGNGGYNSKYRKFGNGGKKHKRRGSGYSRALTQGEAGDNSSWGAFGTLDDMVRWSLISIFIVFGLLLIVSGCICMIKKEEDSIIEKNTELQMQKQPNKSGQSDETQERNELIIREKAVIREE